MQGLYPGKLECAGSTDIEFLDLSSSIVGGKVVYKPHIKSLKAVLGHHSCHPAAMHMSWPLAYLKSLYMHSSSISNFLEARDVFVSRLRLSGMHPRFISFIQDNSQYFIPSNQRQLAAQPKVNDCIHVPFVYHPLLRRGVFNRAFRQQSSDIFCANLWKAVFQEDCPTFMPTWSLGTRPFGSSIISW